MTGRLLKADDLDLQKYDLFVDLDALETQTTGFLLHGVPRIIVPVDTHTFLIVSNAMARLQGLARQEKITVGDAKSAYLELFTKLCKPFDAEDLAKMSQHQCAALAQTIEDHFVGRYRKSVSEKKKTLKTRP